jgi:SAM-dependent methyltransferase
MTSSANIRIERVLCSCATPLTPVHPRKLRTPASRSTAIFSATPLHSFGGAQCGTPSLLPVGSARYDAVADFYEDGWTDSYGDAVSVALFELLGPLHGSRVLDVACGHGRITRELARRGAHVVGVDLSVALLDKARVMEDHDPLGIEYVQADVTANWSPPGEAFDAVSCSFGLSDIDDLDACVDAVDRGLRPGGRFVFSLLHPCFAGGGEVSGSWSPAGSYADEGWWAADGQRSTLRRVVGANHRMLSTYVNALRAHDLVLDAMTEPAPPPEWVEQAPEAARFPVFLVAGCVKQSARR